MIPSVVVGTALALANSQQQLKLLSFTLFIKDRKTVFHNQITLIYQSGIRQLSKKKKKTFSMDDTGANTHSRSRVYSSPCSYTLTCSAQTCKQTHTSLIPQLKSFCTVTLACSQVPRYKCETEFRFFFGWVVNMAGFLFLAAL